MNEPKNKLKVGSIWLFNCHDFQGIYVFTGASKFGNLRRRNGVEDDYWTYDFEAIMVTPNCDTEIDLTWKQVEKYGKQIYGNLFGWMKNEKA